MVECLPEVEAQPQPLLWCPSGDKSVVLLKFSLLLPDPSTCQWEVNWVQWSLRFHFPDSFSSSPQNAVLGHSVSHTVCSHEQFKYHELLFSWFFRALSLTKIYWKPPLDLYLFLVFQTIRMQLISWSFSQLASGSLLFLNCLLSLLWLLWFTLAHSFAFGQGVPLCGNAFWSSH